MKPARIAILSGGRGWHVQDLMRAAAGLELEVAPLDFRHLSATAGHGKPCLASFDAAVVRTMPAGSLEQIVFRMDVLQRAEAAGVYLLNRPATLEACIDKYLATARLEAAGLPVPATTVCQTAEQALATFADLGRDVVIKPLFGSEGRGMMRIADEDVAWRVFRALERTGAVLYLQRFIEHPGWDVRALVLGECVLAGMRRHADGGWRTNVAQGGRPEAITLSEEERSLALRAAKALGASVAGVDLLRGREGYYVLEVNGVPGWRALAAVSGVDVGRETLRFVKAQVER